MEKDTQGNYNWIGKVALLALNLNIKYFKRNLINSIFIGCIQCAKYKENLKFINKEKYRNEKKKKKQVYLP